jgi:hypothetical protein
MKTGSSWSAEERAEIEVLCQRNRELLLRVDIMLGMRTSLETLSTREILIVTGLMIEENKRHIAELESTLQNYRRQTEKRGGDHDRQ